MVSPVLNGRVVPALRRLGTSLTAETTVTASDVNTTETVLSTLCTFPANFFSVGKSIKVSAMARFTGSGVGGPTVRVRLRYGGVSGTILADTGVVTLATGAQTNAAYWFELISTCITTGATGTVWTNGMFVYPGLAAIATADLVNPMGTGTLGTANSSAATVDTTTTNTLVFTAEWSGNAAGNSISMGPGAVVYEL